MNFYLLFLHPTFSLWLNFLPTSQNEDEKTRKFMGRVLDFRCTISCKFSYRYPNIFDNRLKTCSVHSILFSYCNIWCTWEKRDWEWVAKFFWRMTEHTSCQNCRFSVCDANRLNIEKLDVLSYPNFEMLLKIRLSKLLSIYTANNSKLTLQCENIRSQLITSWFLFFSS